MLSTPFASADKLTGFFIAPRYFMDGANGRCRGLFVRPSASKNPVVHNASRDSVLFRNFGPRSVLVAHMDNGAVTRLRLFIRPCAIFWVVAKRVVLSLNRHVVGVSRQHGPCVELLKLEPFLAYVYPLSPVVFVRHVAAPSEHVAPTGVNSRSLHSVRSSSRHECLRTLAAARRAFPVSQVASNNNALGSAGAFAQPQRSAFGRISSFFKHSPFAKNSAGHVDESRVFHKFLTMGLV